MRETHETITKNNICKIACKVYAKALCPENLMSAFRKTDQYLSTGSPVSLSFPSEVFGTVEEPEVDPQADVSAEPQAVNEGVTSMFEA